ncbi:Protein of unknown function, DUF255 [Chitinophaga rupis]|uniref:Thioredoxin domain-containing protein n=2 Tax=Chitinophaga rupis TaxID=573321 RepID=A0A1H7RUH2_9BACT|nr:Protein of unknown function, DUF255 [Chitinophaga rupis]
MICTSLTLHAQNKGIKFEEELSWQQLLSKAKKENKYIFVDCYTTWCGPCRTMEKEVYPQESVGDFMNATFISVKVQIDKTPKDDKRIKDWYSDAEAISRKYKIQAFPTYLFISPNGTLTSKEIGQRSTADFISIAKTSLLPSKKYIDPFNEYDKLIVAYRRGKKNYQKIPYMFKTSTDLQETKLADSLRRDYYKHLQHLKLSELYNKPTIEFLSINIQSSKDPFFKLFYPNGQKVDSVMQRGGVAQETIDRILAKEETRILFNNTKFGSEPEWDTLYDIIRAKYDSYNAERAVLLAKVDWYLENGNSPAYIKYFIEQVEKYGTDTTDKMMDAALNNFSCKVLAESNDIYQINTVIKWMEGVIKRKCCEPMAMIWDTYATLLYKAGRTKEAIQWEEKAIASISGVEVYTRIADFYRATLDKMNNGEPLR